MIRQSMLALLICMAAACGRQAGRDAPAQPVAFDGAQAPAASEKIAHGRRIAQVLGCKGCHGEEFQGKRFYESYASNLTRAVPRYDDTQLERLLREGRPIGGRDLWGMPSELFQHLSAPDLAALTAYLRTLTPAGGPDLPPLPFEEETRKLIAKGELKPAAQSVIDSRSRTPVDLGPSHALGRYITMVTCAECHGPKLEGGGDGPPNLIVAGTYTRAEFETLMTRGVPNGARKLGLMASVAKGRFSRMTRHERDALYRYLKARAEQPH